MTAISNNNTSSSANIKIEPFPDSFPLDVVLDIIEQSSRLFPVGVFQFVCKEWYGVMHRMPAVRQALAIEWAVTEARGEENPLLKAELYLIILRKADKFSHTIALQIFDEAKTLYTQINDKRKQRYIYWQFFEIKALLDESGTLNIINTLEGNAKIVPLLTLAKLYPGKGYLEPAEKQIEILEKFDSELDRMVTEIKLLHVFRKCFQDIVKSYGEFRYNLDVLLCKLLNDQSEE